MDIRRKMNDALHVFIVLSGVMVLWAINLANAQADSFAVNFVGDGSVLSPVMTEGLVPQQNWNNGYSSDGKGSIAKGMIKDAAGLPVSDVSVAYSFGAQGRTEQNAGNHPMHDGSIVVQTSYESHTLSLKGVPYEQYSVYLYIGFHKQEGRSSVKLHGDKVKEFFCTTKADSFSDYLISSDTKGTYPSANTVVFHRVTGSDVNLEVMRHYWSTGVFGFQVVSESDNTPEVSVVSEYLSFGLSAQSTGIITRTVEISNIGYPGTMLSIDSLDFSILGDFSVVDVYKTGGERPVAPDYTNSLASSGESLFVVLGLNTDIEGKYEGDFTINTNDPDHLQWVVPASGVVKEVKPLPVTQGLRAHFDAGSLTNLIEHGGKTDIWHDLSGNGYDVTSVDLLASAPTYLGNELNGHPVLRFKNGTNLSRIDALGFIDNPAATIVTVLKSNIAYSRYFMIGASERHTEGQMIGLGTDASYRYNNGYRRFTPGMDAGVFGIATFRRSAGASYGSGEFNKNGNWINSDFTQNASYRISIPSPSTRPVATRIGSGWGDYGTLQEPLDGDIAELIVYDRALSDSEVIALGSFLATKYALDTNFPRGGAELGVSNSNVEFPSAAQGGPATTITVELNNKALSDDPLLVTAIDLSNAPSFNIKVMQDSIEVTSYPITLASLSDEKLEVLVSIDTSEENFAEEYILVIVDEGFGNTAKTISLVARVARISIPPVSDGLKLHLDASNISGLTSGEKVLRWDDTSTYQNHAMPTWLYQAPTYWLRGPTDKPIVRFDGVNDFVRFSYINNISTAFVVMLESDRGASSNRWRSILSSSEGHGGPYFHRGTGDYLLSNVYGNQNAVRGTTWVNGIEVNSLVTISPVDLGIITFLPDGQSEADQLASDRNMSGRFLGGDYAEVILYDRALNELELQVVGTYLTEKWGINGSAYTAPEPAAAIGVDPTEIQFGVIPQGAAPVEKYLEIHDRGIGVPLRITSITSSNPAYTVSFFMNSESPVFPITVDKEISSLYAIVTFDPTIKGRNDGNLIIESNDLRNNILTIPMSASVLDEWRGADVGYTPTPGYANISPDEKSIEITASGDDFWQDTDDFHFVYKKLSGDGSITARVAYINPLNASAYTKAGVLMRKNLTTGAPNMFSFCSFGNGALYSWRHVQNDPTFTLNPSLRNSFRTPCWVRVERKGNILTASFSRDGTNWLYQISSVYDRNGPQSIDIDDEVYIGLGLTVSKGDSPDQVSATFDNITITGAVSDVPDEQEVFVAANATGTNDGSSWDNALTTNVQLAIDKVAKSPLGGTVWVDSGIYYLTEQLNMRSNVSVIGVGESKPVFVQTAVERRVVEFDRTQNVTFSGIVLTGGNLRGVSSGAGVRFYYADASNQLLHCDVAGNQASWDGTGLSFHQYSNPVISGCRIVGNRNGGLGDQGSVIFGNSSSAPVIENSVISGNASRGGLLVFDSGNKTVNVSNCTISNNIVSDNALIDMQSGEADIINNIISDNVYTSPIFTPENTNQWHRVSNILHGNSVAESLGESDVLSDPQFSTSSLGLIDSFSTSTLFSILTISGADFSPEELVGSLVSPNADDFLQAVIIGNTTNTITVLNHDSMTTNGSLVKRVDYRLIAGSPAEDAGTSITFINPFDADGKIRPGNYVTDIGAYEIADDYRVIISEMEFRAGIMYVGDPATTIGLTLNNVGANAVYWRASITGPNADDFQTTETEGKLDSGYSDHVLLHFSPETFGSKEAELSFTFYENASSSYTVTSTITMPLSGMAVEEVSLSVAIPVNGKVSFFPETSYVAPSVVVLTATPNPGYKLTEWTVNSTTRIGNPLIFDITTNTHVTAQFDSIMVDLNIVSEHGEVITSPHRENYEPGSIIMLSVKPDKGFEFTGWVGENVPTDQQASSPLTLQMDEDTTVTATYNRLSFPVHVSQPLHGEIITTLSEQSIPFETELEFFAYPDDHYHFKCWMVNGNPVLDVLGSSFTLKVEEETTVSVDFEVDFFSVALDAKNGMAMALPLLHVYDYGTTVTVTATPLANYHITGWMVNDVLTTEGVSTSMTLVITGDTTVTALFSIDTFTLDVVEINGTVDVAPLQASYDYGTTLTLTAGADPNYYFAGWNIGSSTDTSITVVITNDLKVIADFALFTYALHTIAENGAVSISPRLSAYDHGTTVTVTAMPAENYYFSGWIIEGQPTRSSMGTTISLVMTNETTVTATFSIFTYALGLVAENGDVEVSPASDVYDHGTTITLVAIPAENYFFTGWAIDGHPTTASMGTTISLVMTNETTVTATFEIFTYALDVVAENGNVEAIPALDVYEHGTTVTLVASPAANYHFVVWSNGDTATSTSVVMTQATTVTATFAIDTFAVVTHAVNGSVGASPEMVEYAYGTTITFVATPSANYHFTGWGGDAVGMDNPIIVTVDSAKAITATFAIDTYSVATDAINGSVTKSPDQAAYNFGATVELTATPEANYHFTGWMGDASGMTNPVTVTVDSAKSVIATFAIDSYAVTASAQVGGTVAVDPDQTVFDYGTQATITAIPDEGFRFIGWTGAAIGSVQTNPLTVAVEDNVTVEAMFEVLPDLSNYKITYKKSGFDIDSENNIVLTDSSAKSSLKIAYLKKLPKNIESKEGTRYLLDTRMIPSITIDGDFGKIATDIPIWSLSTNGAVKSITTKRAAINSVTVECIGGIKMGAVVDASQEAYDTTALSVTGGAAVKGFKAAFSGVIVIRLDSAQSLKSLGVTSKAFRNSDKVKTYSLSGIGSVEQVLAGVPVAGDEISLVSAPVITSISAKGAAVCPDMISGGLGKISVQPVAFSTASGVALIEGNLAPGTLASSTAMKSITAAARKVGGVRVGGGIGVPGNITATVIMVNGNISAISAQDLSATILAGFDNSQPTFTGMIKKITVKGTIAGEAYVSTEIKFSPKSLDTDEFDVNVPQG